MRRHDLYLLIAAMCVATGPHASAQPLKLTPKTTIVISSDEPEPVQHAAEDLASDFGKVLGTTPEIVRSKGPAGGPTVVIGEHDHLPQSLRFGEKGAPESFTISAAVAKQTIVLEGSDVRGTMYAVYEFSQKYLGVDPMYFWTDSQPAHQTAISIPALLHHTYPAPVFRYRGVFINDEDLLTGWAPAPANEQTGIALDVWNKIYETTLRLKGNMIAPGTWIFPNDGQVRLAAKRGLIVTQHHAIPLGVNVARWPKDIPYNYSSHPEILERAWRNAVSEYLPDQEVLWSVGLRGLSDVSYASMDPAVRDDNKALGRLISKAIAGQVQIVRSIRPDAQFVTNLWQEGARLQQQGDLTIPSEVHTVWADAGWGYLQDHGEVKSGEGAYDHIAMMNGRANQLTEMVPIDRSFSEMGRYIKAGATFYYLVNTSDIRPVTMSMRAVMDAAWEGLPKGPDPVGAFYNRWATEEFGKDAAPKLATLYKDYYAAPAYNGEPKHEYGDQYYHTVARSLLLSYMTDAPLYTLPGQAPKWEPPRLLLPTTGGYRPSGKEWLNRALPNEIQRCGDAQSRWDAVWKEALSIEPMIPAERRPFYHAQVLSMIAIDRESNRMLYLVAKALQEAQQNQKAQAHADVSRSLAAFDEIARQESQAEYGKWQHWYRGDWLTGIYRTRQIIAVLDKFLDDPETHMAPPLLWDGWEAYYHIMHYEDDRSVDVQ